MSQSKTDASMVDVPYCVVQRITSQQTGIANVTPTKIQFNSVVEDNKSWWDAGNYRYTPQKAGMYRVSVSVDTTASGMLLGAAYIYKNGALQYQAYNNTTGLSQTVAGLVRCNGSSDYIEGWTYINGSSGQAVNSGPGTAMCIEYVGP